MESYTGCILLVSSFFGRLSSVFDTLQNPVLLVYCLPKTVGLEGLPNPFSSRAGRLRRHYKASHSDVFS